MKSCTLLGILFFGAIIFLDPLFAIAQKTSPTCSIGQDYIILQSAKAGFVCLDDGYMQNLQSLLLEYRSRLNGGGDIIPMLAEIRENMKNASRYDQEYGKIYAIILDRMKSYGGDLCKRENQKAELVIPDNSIYSHNSLTPVCVYPKVRVKNTQMYIDISLTWKGIGGNQFMYHGSGGTFSGLTLNIHGTGEHIITCNYRPNYCTTPNSIQKRISISSPVQKRDSKYSIARIWNEIVLNAIRKDKVRPPVQARNLFHISAAMYDIWSLYHPGNDQYLFGKNNSIRSCRIPNKEKLGKNPEDIDRAISYAAYRMITYRYKESPGYTQTLEEANSLMNSLGFSTQDLTENLNSSSRATALGNTVARCYIEYGRTDGSNEQGISQVGESGTHANEYYSPINPPLDMNGTGGNLALFDWNRWQPLSVGTFIDQAGNNISGGAATFIGAEWGNVKPFSLREDQKMIHERDGHKYMTYLDPGSPPKIASDEINLNDISTKIYKWNFELVGLWSSHLDPKDRVMIDISPAKLGNVSDLPTTFQSMMDFYDMKNGGTKANGRPINPKTGIPYSPEIVPRGDYTRVIAEFWADGPNSETPPGHWFTLLNTVSDNIPEKYWQGRGNRLDPLEWDIKSYFTLGGAMHDAAIGAWGMKGAYDGIRPVSVIRAMASHGQATEKNLPNYDPLGFDLIPGYIESVNAGDVLEGKGGVNIGKIKIRAWKGPKYVFDQNIDYAGVDWILAENWWPYQRSSFVTPPFAGYVSGHSTFSRAAAEVLTSITGDEYFPGGIMKWPTRAHNYLVFEQGPSKDITLQWATYRDAANESALSRIWGGIHPPMDDIPGRILGEKIGTQAVEYANTFFRKN